MRPALFLLAASVAAAAPVERTVPWEQLRYELRDTFVVVQTNGGTQEKGAFGAWSPTEIKIVLTDGVKRLARGQVRSMEVFREVPARRLRALRRSYREELAESRDLAFSEHAVAGIAYFGLMTGVRAAALPFCAIGDLFAEVDWKKPNERLTIQPEATR